MGNWKSFTTVPSGFVPETMILLTDGSVLAHGSGSKTWRRLTPHANGSYLEGAWSGPLNMANTRQFFACGVTTDGRVYAIGGEFSDAGKDTTLAEIFDPATNLWSKLEKPGQFSEISGDVASCMLADGRVLLGGLLSSATAIWDPQNESWEEAGTAFGSSGQTKDGNTNEETWTLLRDGSVLTVETKPSKAGAVVAEKYLPAADTWVSAGEPTQGLVIFEVFDSVEKKNVAVFEIGPAILLPDGKLFAIGATGHTQIYTPPANPSEAGKWEAGPDLPADTSAAKLNSANGNIKTSIDAPACLLPSGRVLCCAGNMKRELSEGKPVFFGGPTEVCVFDPEHPATITALAAQPANNSGDTWTARMLLLPTGQVLFSSQETKLSIYTPDASDGSPKAAWKPTISDCPAEMVLGHTYTISGTHLTGFSQANSYGDDAQMATNYPIVRITNPATSEVRYMRTFNPSTRGVAVPGTITTEVEVPHGLATGQWSLEVIANGIASNPVNVEIAARDLIVYLDENSFGQNQVAALLEQNGGNPVSVNPVAHVVIEGFSAQDVAALVPSIPDPAEKIHLGFVGPFLPEDPALPPTALQRFTFPFQITFDDDSPFNSAPETLTIEASFESTSGDVVSGSAQLELKLTPNPYILHGDASEKFTWYLSQDIRVFQVTPNSTKFGVPWPAGNDVKTQATAYIAAVIEALNQHGGSGLPPSGESFDAISEDEDQSALEIGPLDGAGNPVFNFALARVHYQDTQTAENLRVFFRMYAAQQTASTYDSNTTYRETVNQGQKIPLLGVQGDEIVTIPFFASPRPASGNLTEQTDPPNVVKHVQPGAGGAAVAYYFGCWLDINQPNEKLYPDRIVAGNRNGPFAGSGPLLAIQQWARSAHQCLVAQVSYDPDPIPPSADPSGSDKLAQRNLTFVGDPNPGVPASRRAPQTLEIRPSRRELLADRRPDELVIQWGDTPLEGTAQIFLPDAAIEQTLAWADRLYTTHRLTQLDEHTVEFPIGGVTYIPIPQGGEVNFAGLLTVEVPYGVRKGQVFNVLVKQVTSAEAKRGGVVGRGNLERDVLSVNHSGGDSGLITWRRTIGMFNLTIPISTKQALLHDEQRLLSILRWIQLSIPSTSGRVRK